MRTYLTIALLLTFSNTPYASGKIPFPNTSSLSSPSPAKSPIDRPRVYPVLQTSTSDFIQTTDVSSYYPTAFIDDLNSGELSDDELKSQLYRILAGTHQKNGTDNDSIGCSSQNRSSCYRQANKSYYTARKILFGSLHLEADGRGAFVEDVYCKKKIRPTRTSIGPEQIPDSNIMNCEHTWPQSRFSHQFSRNTQKTDLHHLFPTDSKANSVRGHSTFAEVDLTGKYVRGCRDSMSEPNGDRRFQPPESHRGNIARALFYFSSRYKLSISSREEKFLRKWDLEDPVDAREISRNNKIYMIQNNRNPFIDFPELASHIANF